MLQNFANSELLPSFSLPDPRQAYNFYFLELLLFTRFPTTKPVGSILSSPFAVLSNKLTLSVCHPLKKW